MLSITKTIEGSKAILKPDGRLDTATAPDLDKAIKEVIPAAAELVLDLEKLDYISSAGLRVLLTAHKEMMKKNGMKVLNVSGPIMEIFDVTCFSDILDIEN